MALFSCLAIGLAGSKSPRFTSTLLQTHPSSLLDGWSQDGIPGGQTQKHGGLETHRIPFNGSFYPSS